LSLQQRAEVVGNVAVDAIRVAEGVRLAQAVSFDDRGELFGVELDPLVGDALARRVDRDRPPGRAASSR
jgi:hypothetical protein